MASAKSSQCFCSNGGGGWLKERDGGSLHIFLPTDGSRFPILKYWYFILEIGVLKCKWLRVAKRTPYPTPPPQYAAVLSLPDGSAVPCSPFYVVSEQS